MSSTRSVLNVANKYERVILLIDMDCFYCQVEVKLNPSLAGKPLAVVQYNAWRGGGIIAVNYEARSKGVSRHMRGDEAKEQCPDIVLAKVPNIRQKADLTKYRDAGKQVANVLQKFTSLLERASVDEAYLDITEQVNNRLEDVNNGTFKLNSNEFNNTYAVGYEYFGHYIDQINIKMSDGLFYDDDDAFSGANENEIAETQNSDLKLLIGASISNEIRAKVKAETGYECSAGIAHNKILAKLACGINKPNKQTVLSFKQVPELFRTLPIGKLKGLGGKFGEDVCDALKIKFLGDLSNFSEAELHRRFDEKNGSWLYLIAQGVDLEAVTVRLHSKSIGCCKKFPGRNALVVLPTLTHWLKELANEIGDRLDKDIIENNRRAKQMVVSFTQEISGEEVSSSRSMPLTTYEPEVIARNSLEIIKKNTDVFIKADSNDAIHNPIKFLGISVNKFENIENNNQATLKQMFANQKKIENKPIIDVLVKNDESVKKTVQNFFANHKSNKESLPSASTNEQITTSNYSSQIISTSDTIQEKTKEDLKPIAPTHAGSYNSSEEKSFFRRILPGKTAILDSHLVPEKSKPFPEFSINQRSNLSNRNRVEIDLNKPHELEEKNAKDIKIKIQEPMPHIKSFFFNAIKRKSEELNNTAISEDYEIGESSANNLSETDAGLAKLDIGPEHFTKCSTCGVDVLNEAKSIQSHNDRHLAEQLSQQQRTEYRNEILSRVKSPPQKKIKTSQSSAIRTDKSTSITKYLKKPNEPPPEVVPSTSSSHTRCTECGVFVEISKIAEHTDFHLAKKIQLELNKSEMQIITIEKSKNSPVGMKSKQTTRKKSISQFFQPQ